MRVLFLLLAATASAQQFEVASIRRDYTDSAGVMLATSPRVSGTRAAWDLVSLQQLIHYAYRPNRIEGLPGWARNGGAWYDIGAKAEGDEPPRDDQLRVMFQNLLAERFQLKFHREMREIPIYSLAPAKGGVRLKESADGELFKYSQQRKEVDGSVVTELNAARMSMDSLAGAVSGPAGRRVVNKTGLPGLYDVRLEWVADNLGAGPSIFEALKDLGLELEPSKMLLEILVVDHVEPPSPN